MMRVKISSPGYKSIPELEWNDIPEFCVVTGKNGSGKTHLLQAIQRQLKPNSYPAPAGKIEIDGFMVQPEEVGFVGASAGLQHGERVDYRTVTDVRNNIVESLRSPDPRPEYKRGRGLLLAKYGTVNPSQLKQQRISEVLKDDLVFMLEPDEVLRGLGYIFVAHRVRVIQAVEKHRDMTWDVAMREIGDPPWEKLNVILRQADFGFEFTSPLNDDLFEPFAPKLQSLSVPGLIIHPSELSSGEVMILRLLLWMFATKVYGLHPKLLLLDEPDAHLHPSQTRQLLRVLHETLVGEYHTRIILTTHSPDTVMFAPDGSVFMLERSPHRITRCETKAKAIEALCSSLLYITADARYVLVEDTDDEEFYRNVMDISDIEAERQLVFLPVSGTDSSARGGGGSKTVEKWTRKLSDTKLPPLFAGIIDRDTRNQSEGRIYALNRYSIENYLLEITSVLALIIEDDLPASKEMPSLNLKRGRTNQIGKVPDSVLQSAADWAFGRIAEDLRQKGIPSIDIDIDTKAVKLTSGQTIKYPLFWLNYRGHDLLEAVSTHFGSRAIHRKSLVRVLFTTRVIANDLVDILQKIMKQD